MKKQICSLMVVLGSFHFAANAFAETANISQEIPGDSLAEKQIRWVWAHRLDFIQACAMSDCIKQEPVKSLLPKIAMLADRTRDSQLQFKSERANPGFFSSNLGESHRIAITGREPGSPIYFNTDLIGNLTIENTVAILFHEWTHHLGIADDAQRLPDQVGAMMAKDFKANLIYSPYRGPDNLQFVSAVFQFPVPKETLNERFFYKNFGLLTDGQIFLDTDLGKFNLTSACDKEGFEVGGQVTSTPIWREAGIVNGQRQVRLTMIVVNACFLKSSTGKLADYHYARRGYRFDIDIDKNGHLMRSSEEAFSDAYQADIDYASTLEFLSVKYSKPQVKVGETLQISMQVKSYTSLNPRTCDFGISSEGAPLQGGGYPVVNEIPGCKVKVVGENLWEISTSLKVPASMASGNYYPRAIKVVGDGTPNTAFLFLPEQNGFNVINDKVTTAFSLKSIEVGPGVKPVAKFGAQAITNSYEYKQGQKIELRITVNSSTPVHVKALSTYTMSVVNNQLQALQNTASLEDYTGFNFKQKTLDAGPGLKTIVLTFTIPERFSNAMTFGMSIQGIFLEDDAFQQSIWKASGPWDYLFIDTRLMDSNR